MPFAIIPALRSPEYKVLALMYSIEDQFRQLGACQYIFPPPSMPQQRAGVSYAQRP